jgi:hypothetical protein
MFLFTHGALLCYQQFLLYFVHVDIRLSVVITVFRTRVLYIRLSVVLTVLVVYAGAALGVRGA